MIEVENNQGIIMKFNFFDFCLISTSLYFSIFNSQNSCLKSVVSNIVLKIFS